MKTEDFNYELPEYLIAQTPLLKRDTSKFVEIFKQKLEEQGYNYKIVRIFELSLFLSMLPLHIDNRRKVLGFLLNSIRILEELKNDK